MTTDALKNLHIIWSVRRHTTIPYMWRSVCTCGLYFLAPSEEKAYMAIENHINQEEPFPDIGLTNEGEKP